MGVQLGWIAPSSRSAPPAPALHPPAPPRAGPRPAGRYLFAMVVLLAVFAAGRAFHVFRQGVPPTLLLPPLLPCPCARKPCRASSSA